jgi:hypothetical protein
MKAIAITIVNIHALFPGIHISRQIYLLYMKTLLSI